MSILTKESKRTGHAKHLGAHEHEEVTEGELVLEEEHNTNGGVEVSARKEEGGCEGQTDDGRARNGLGGIHEDGSKENKSSDGFENVFDHFYKYYVDNN